MDMVTRIDVASRYQVVDQLAFNADTICVLQGKYIHATVARKSVTAFRLERRTSFKHPRIGWFLGIVMAGLPLQAWTGDPLGLWWLLLATDGRFIGSIFMFCFGLAMLWMVARRRDVQWIVFIFGSGERSFPLEHDLSPEALAMLNECFEASGKDISPQGNSVD